MIENILDVLTGYNKRGFVCHPLSSPTDRGDSPGKKPLLKGWQMLKHTPPISQFPPGCNIGLVCGKASGITVIDFDSLLFASNCCTGDVHITNAHLTLVSRRTTGRGHIFYKYDPGLKSQKHHLLGIEILSDCSNAVLPPSVHSTGDVYKWMYITEQAAQMPDDVKERLLELFSIEAELKQRVGKCRQCFKRVLKDYPGNVPDVNGTEGRQFMLAICTDLIALGAKLQHLLMFCKLMYREKYDEQRTKEEISGIDQSKTWRCETLRERLPGYVNCEECVNHKFKMPEQTERMKVTIPASIREITLVIEKEVRQ